MREWTSILVAIVALVLECQTYPVRAQIRINEHMPIPASGEAEWVEVINLGDSLRDLTGWVLHDAGTARPLLPAGLRLPPRGLLVLAKDTSVASRYALAPELLRVMPNLPSLNNTGDVLVLRRPDATVEDEVRWEEDWGAVSGRSLERIDPLASGQERDNWTPSRDPRGATPGARNSRARRDRDLLIARIESDGPRLHVFVRNAGYEPLPALALRLALDRNGDGVENEGELLVQVSLAALAPLDSLRVTESPVLPGMGWVTILARVEWPEDEDPSNNGLMSAVWTDPPSPSLQLNEIQASPLPGDPEWMEYLNRTNEPINVEGWTLGLGITEGPGLAIATARTLVPAGGFLVLAADSGLLRTWPECGTHPEAVLCVLSSSRFSLLNEEGLVRLRTPRGGMVDSQYYASAWHHPSVVDPRGISLERIHPDLVGGLPSSWSSCTDSRGGTPGRRNSLYRDSPPGSASLEGLPSIFSPDGDGWEDFCLIRVRSPFSVARMRIRIFDTEGRVVRTLASDIPVGSEGSIAWDGRDDGGRILPVGPYVLVSDVLEEVSNKTERSLAVVVVAKRL